MKNEKKVEELTEEEFLQLINSMTPFRLGLWYYEKVLLEKVEFTEKQKEAIYAREDLDDTVYTPQRYSEQKNESTISINMNCREVKSFIAVDFETASVNRMACQIGIVVVKDLKVIQEKLYWIRPPGDHYDINCMRVHRIAPEDTITKPYFDEVWKEIEPLFNAYPVVAHNAVFDVDVLNKNLLHYGLNPLELSSIFCTSRLHGKVDLYSCCVHYGLELHSHHDGLNDAKLCAQIFMNFLESKEEFVQVPKVKRERKISRENLTQDLTQVNNRDLIFYDKRVVITGIFIQYPDRNKLAEILKSYGADINTAISNKTDIVVVGKGCGPSKMKKVEAINESGGNILVMDEAMLVEELNKSKP